MADLVASTGNRPDDVAGILLEVAKALRARSGVDATLSEIVDLATSTVDGCDHAGVTLFRDDKFSTPAASSELPEKIDLIQYETGQGPCVEAVLEGDVQRSDDLGEDGQWPEFAARVVLETDVRSVLSYRLITADTFWAALNLYGTVPGAFVETAATDTGAAFAALAALSLDRAYEQDENEGLRTALETSRVIGAAVGIVMAHYRVTRDEAFQLLREVSQHANRKLRELAEYVVDTGEVPRRPDK